MVLVVVPLLSLPRVLAGRLPATPTPIRSCPWPRSVSLVGRPAQSDGWMAAACVRRRWQSWAPPRWWSSCSRGPGTAAQASREAKALLTQRQTPRPRSGFGPDGTFYALGDPAPLVLMQRRNLSPEIYLAAGVDAWVIEHKPADSRPGPRRSRPRSRTWSSAAAGTERRRVRMRGGCARCSNASRSGTAAPSSPPEVRGRATGPPAQSC